MTTITAKVIADSISPQEIRLTTLELRYPRCIHSEFMTHRQFSRNAASSRAIPVKKMIESIRNDPFIPLHWGANQKGMQADKTINKLVACYPLQNGEVFFDERSPKDAWLLAMKYSIVAAMEFDRAGYHKQTVNRLLEPFMHITVVVTATEWSNFFALRDHKDAEPHIAMLAREIRAAMDGCTPIGLKPGEWHLPYVSPEDWLAFSPDHVTGGDGDSYDDAVEALREISAARCARTSYLTHDGQRPLHSDDRELYQRLAGSQPIHASPLEHQATPDKQTGVTEQQWFYPSQHGNLRGWRQFRKMLPGECQ